MNIFLGLTLAVFVTGFLSACQTASYRGGPDRSHHLTSDHLEPSKGRDD